MRGAAVVDRRGVLLMSRLHTKAARRRAFRDHCARVRLGAWLAGHPSPAAWDEWVAMRAADDRSRRLAGETARLTENAR